MTLRHADRTEIKQYLLGEATQESRLREIEERLLTDESFYEEVLASEDELIDEYLDGSLTSREREEFEAHFLCTAERRRKLKFARSLRRYVAGTAAAEASNATVETQERSARRERSSPWSKFFGFYLPAAASVVLILGLAFVVWRVYFRETDADKGLLALNAAYRDQRPIETRVSALKDYAPFVVTRGDEQVKVDALSRERAERLLLDAAQDNPGPAAQHALGQFYLTGGQPDRAAEQFESALKAEPNDARLHSDLGAARIEMAKSMRARDEGGEDLRQLALAIEHLNRALALDADLHEALFNRALCHEHMNLSPQAEEDWRTYLEKDPASPWAEEARRKLKLLEEQQKRSARDSGQLLRDFVEAYEAGNEDAA